MRDVILPFVVVGLVITAIVARRVLRPALSNFIALCAATSVLAYASLELYPWLRTSVSFFQPIRIQIEPQASFGASAEGQPSEIAVQVFRGTQLLEEKRIPGLGKAATPPAREPLRLERLESGSGYRVMAGKTALGELTGEALAAAGMGLDLLPNELGEPPEARPEIDVAASGEPDAEPPADALPAAEIPSEPDVAPAPPPRVAKARRPAKRAPQSEADREVALRARASQLARQGSNCEAERLLRDQGRDERTLALARELGARCRWKGR